MENLQKRSNINQSSSGTKRRLNMDEILFIYICFLDPSLHQGRKRTRPHVEGDWPTHVYISSKFSNPKRTQRPKEKFLFSIDLEYISVDLQGKTKDFLDRMVLKLAQEDQSKVWHSLINGNSEGFALHLSLSRPVFLKTNEREEFLNQLKKNISQINVFGIHFSTFSTLVNDECTRGFLALEVGTGHSLLGDLLVQVDNILERFCQPKYYETPKFHVSIAWCLLDKEKVLLKIA
ncbi:hypothetical protein PSHT_08769 [Puccinia striiformis]|uniref:U6 snRNA phosphodiesterase 1 n=1 Tax=Puccinia striiformis TaxID=27350 RepID=A0A2S4VLN6_9BASI|nr:hypothetical protein PSHT_08769 [Puccinia striiformis]